MTRSIAAKIEAKAKSAQRPQMEPKILTRGQTRSSQDTNTRERPTS